MDGRIALATGTALHFQNQSGGAVSYAIRKEIGRGGSCIVYDASYMDNLGNHKLVRVKECYPHALRLMREDNGSLRADTRDDEIFQAQKRRFLNAYQSNHELFSINDLTNTVANTSDIYTHNGTLYIVSTYLNGETLADHSFHSICECASLLLAVAKVLRNIHEAGYLYLDLKPENILAIRGTTELVQLFDFDSMISMKELQLAIQTGDVSAIRASYSKGFAPLEQQTRKFRQLGTHSDVFSLGAVLFYFLWGHTPTAFDCEQSSVFDFDHTAFPSMSYQDRLFHELTSFFHKTLASYTGDRYQTMEEAAAQLEKINNLSDETKPWIISTVIHHGDRLFGREKELASLEELLRQPGHHVFSLFGMGGIGKSTLVREYLFTHQEDYDAILYLYDKGSVVSLLTDDRLVHINTVQKINEESNEEYLQRKLRALSLLAKEQQILVVLDNFAPSRLSETWPLLGIGWQVLLISRERLPEGLFPEMSLSEMEAAELVRLFVRYAHCDITNQQDAEAFLSIANAVRGHTLTMELIARQIAKSYLSLRKAAELVASAGFQRLPTDSVDYVRDHQVMHAPLMKIFDKLLEIDSFTSNDKCLMKLLSLFDAPGIDAALFRELTALREMDVINELAAAGWLKVNGKSLFLHPMLREYVHTWPWQEELLSAGEAMMERLYQRIKPAGSRHDTDKQFPEDYGRLYDLLGLAEQILARLDRATPASQRLRYRLLMDAPVDQDEHVLRHILDLLDDPVYLDDGSVLRLYETSAFLFGRLNAYDAAVEQLKAMKSYLIKHPSTFYLSAYHRAMAVILHNADDLGNRKKCLQHEDKAIAAVHLSPHPDAKKQLAASLLDKATTLLNAGLDMRQCGRLIAEAEPLVKQYVGEYDYERYQYFCISAMYFAMNGVTEEAEERLREATRIADSSRDSALAYIEHLLDQTAPILIEMKQYEEAIAITRKAISLCDEFAEAASYRRIRFDAYLFLARIYAMNSENVLSEETYAEAEKYRDDSPWELDDDEPLCPREIRDMAEAEREAHPVK